MRNKLNIKKIKKRKKILIILFLVFFVIPGAAYFTLKSSKVQTYLIKKITGLVSQKINAKFTFDEIDVSFFNKIVFKNIYIEDQRKDTLLFSKRLTVNISRFSRSEKVVSFSKVLFKDALINFNIDSLNVLNLDFIVKKLESGDTSSSGGGFNVSFKDIELQNSEFRLKQYSLKNKQGVDFSDLKLTDLYVRVRNFSPKDTISMYIENLSFKDKSGFEVAKLQANMSIYKKHLLFDKLSIRTPSTFLSMGHLYFRFKNFKQFKYFYTKVNLDFEFKPSNIGIKDIGFFLQGFEGVNKNIVLSGKIKGKISDLKGKQLSILFGKDTELTGSFDINGLPDISQTYIYANLNRLITSVKDIENLPLPGNKKISLPHEIKNLGIMKYQGNFTGFINDFVAFGRLSTELGTVSSDLLLRPYKNKAIQFKGNLKTNNFNLGKLMWDNKDFNALTMNIDLNGSVSSNQDIEATLDGVVKNIEINKYNYNNIKLSGYLTNKKFDGSISIEDPNINFQFSGRFDFSNNTPVFDFNSSIKSAKIGKLNFSSDTSSALSLSMMANFSGNTIDNINGNIKFLNTLFAKQKDTLQVNDFELIANSIGDIKQISLKSDIIDGEIFGKFRYTSLFSSIKNMAFHYLPSAKTDDSLDVSIDTLNNFTFTFNLKTTKKLTNFFIPDLILSDNAHFSGKYNAAGYDISFDGFSKNLFYKHNTFSNFQFKASSNKDNFVFTAESKKIKSKNDFEITNFVMNSTALKDSIAIRVKWEEPSDSLNNNILAFINFERNMLEKKPTIKINIASSQIIINNEKWQIKSDVVIDSTYIGVTNFKIIYKDEVLSINGAISENPSDELRLKFNKLNLSKLNILSSKTGAKLNGILEGEATLSNLYQNPVFYSDMNISRLSVNNNHVGNTSILSKWDNVNKVIHFEGSIEEKLKNTFSIAGDYSPEEHFLNFDISLNGLGVNIFQPFIKEIFSKMEGVAYGKLKLTGTSKKPVFTGDVELKDVLLEIGYLKTAYKFQAKIPVTEYSFIFNNVVISDQNNHTGILNGSITHKYFKNTELDLNIEATNLQALNTTEKDNSLFYGTAYTSGIIKILGPTQKLSINVAAKTEKNTQIFIPLSDNQEVSESGFITFVNNKKEEAEEFSVNDYDVNLSGIDLNFDLEVTPDAEAQIIFDSKIGDIIKGKGYGNLKMEIKTPGTFKMYGDYTFDEGNYLFTLQNVINKKFEIKPGGTISWNGDPYDATIDIEAVYKLKASIYDLIVDADETRIPVECQLFLSDKLKNPRLSFDISLPTANTETRALLQNTITSEENLKKQFLALIVINNFIPDPNRMPVEDSKNLSSGNGLGKTSAAVTTSELLSNQMSNWLSQISKDFDIGVNYRPGDEITSNEVELALSTQLLNDRVSINGNVDVAGNKQNNTSNIVGDFNVDVKINKSGKLRLKAFTRANDKLTYNETSTQGVGILYKEDFNTFSELFIKYWNTFFKKEEELILE